MDDRFLVVRLQGVFERVDGKIYPAGPFVAPAEGQPNRNVLRFEFASLLERLDSVGISLHHPQGLAGQEEDVSLLSGIGRGVGEGLDGTLGESVAERLGQGPAVAEHASQFQIPFRFADELLATNSRIICHGCTPWA